MSDELTDEERALLEAEAIEEPAAEEPKKTRKPRAAASTSVEEPEIVEAVAEDHSKRVIPHQWHGDPWGDTPIQSRH